MKGWKKQIVDRLESKARNKGIDLRIGQLTILPLGVKHITLKIRGEELSVERLCLFPLLRTLSKDGGKLRIKCQGVSWAAGSFSNIPFSLQDELKGSICLRRKKGYIALEIANKEGMKCILQTVEHPDGKKEFLCKLEQVSIDRYKSWLGGHILSDFMQAIQSDTLLNISCYFCYDPTVLYPQVQAHFEGGDLHIEPRHLTLSKNYLLKKLKEREHLTQHYLPFESLPENIRRLVVCTEDPSFYRHKGICPVQLGMTLQEAFAKRQLGRGGSTLSMQLIKNALLNGERTLCRKLEEAILTLLLENYYGTEKKDILEMYLNMIELAPGVYGVEDGAWFYWNKPCERLTIIEILVLTYIIPRPKHFYEALLLKTEQLQRNLGRHVRHYKEVVIHKNMMDNQELENASMDCIRFSDRFGELPLQ